MEQIWPQAWETGLAFIAWLQTTYPELEEFFLIVTDLGREEFYLLLFPLIYWCLHKTIGKQLGFLFFFTVFINTVFKQAFRGPRPFWLDPAVGLDTRETGYGIPSGHTQNATLVYLFLAAWIARLWFWAFAILLLFLMALSRIYLGAHFIHDVLAGFLLGVLTLAGFAVYSRRYAESFSRRILGQRLLAIILIPIILSIIYILLLILIGEPDMNLPWSEFIPAAERSSIETVALSFGTLLGFGIGILLESSRIRFKVDGPLWKRAVRYLLGMVVLIVIWAGLDQIFPEDPLWLAVPFRSLRYFLVVIWAAYYAPWTFVKIGLATADPPPEINLSLK